VKGKTESTWDRVAHTKQELFMDDSESEDQAANDSNDTDVLRKRTRILYTSKGIPVYKMRHEHGRTDITGDIACNSYYKVDEDVNLLRELGVSV